MIKESLATPCASWSYARDSAPSVVHLTSFRLWRWFAAALLLFVALALMMPANHDEGQYVAAAHFVAKGLLPYRDFPYLQTPLQPYLIAPLAYVAPGWLFMLARLTNALAMALAALFLARTAVHLSGRAIAGPLVVVAFVSIDAVQFGASVARNDALPLVFFAAALERLFAANLISGQRAAQAGLLLALAASTKISYALPAAAVAFQAMYHSRNFDRREVFALLGAMLAGGLPILLFLALQTKTFIFGAYNYSIDAVNAWQQLSGTSELLEWPVRIRRTVEFLARGPALLMLILVAISVGGVRNRADLRPLGVSLSVVLAACILAAVLPTPAYRQYIVPVVPPLVLMVALRGEALLDWLRPGRAMRSVTAAVLIASLGFGSARSVSYALNRPLDRRPLAIERQAHEIGRHGLTHGGGAIAGLDPLLLVDSGLDFDPRFASGPFLFRAGNLIACRDPELCPVTFASLKRLDRDPPRFILTGSERRSPRNMEGGLDLHLDRWAAERNYSAITLTEGHVLWVEPVLNRLHAN